MQAIMNSMIVSWFIIFMVGFYTLYIFIIISLEELLSQDVLDANRSTFQWIEMSILMTFVLEIIMHLISKGLRYFRDRWLVVDMIIIVVSILFVALELSQASSKVTKNFISVLQAIFRFLRIFLLIRKKIKKTGNIKTPAEKILEFLGELKDIVEIIDIQLDLAYCIDHITSNTLFESDLLFDGDDEAALFMKQYQVNKEQQPLQHQSPTLKAKTQLDLKLTEIPPHLQEVFKAQHDDLYINPFLVDQNCKGQGLINLMIFLFVDNNLLGTLGCEPKVFKTYFTQIMNGYRDNIYHNRIHSFDVTQTTNFFIKKCKFQELGMLTEIDLISMYTAASIHDYDHPGVNNTFLTNTRDVLALRYNDKSILEAYHVSSAFQLSLKPDQNIFGQLSRENFKIIRDSIVGMVLSTDMAFHFADIAKLKARIVATDFDIKAKDKQICMEAIIHACDVSNPIKEFDVYKAWTERVLGEFWQQGDQERQLKLPISYLCDKYTTNMAKAQLGFIDFVVRPLMTVLNEFLPIFNEFLPNLDANKAKWNDLIPYYDEYLKKLNEDREKEQIQ